MLAEAALAIENDEDDAAALGHLLDAWRSEPLPAIAELIDVLSERITAKRERIVGKTQKARLLAWHAVERQHDPADLGRLLALIWPRRSADALPLLKKLREWPADPRISMALVQLAEREEWATNDSAFAGHLLKCIETIGDVRALEWIERRYGGGDPKKHISFVSARWAVQALHAKELPTQPSDTSAFESLTRHLHVELKARAEKARGNNDLLAAIYASPDDDDVRQVYADFLTERDDPRGEFITLQLARARGESNAAMLRRENQLLARHIKEWTSNEALHKVSDPTAHVFERGFLSEVTLTRAVETVNHALFRDPFWSTVRIYRGQAWIELAFAAILAAGAAPRRSVRGLLDLTVGVAAWLASPNLEGMSEPQRERMRLRISEGERESLRAHAAAQLEEIGLILNANVGEIAENARALITQAANLPKVTRLRVVNGDRSDGAWLFGTPLWNRLLRLHVQPLPDNMAEWIRRARQSGSTIASLHFRSYEWSGGWWNAQFDGPDYRRCRLQWVSAKSRAYRQMMDLEQILRVVSDVGVTDLVIEPSRGFRPSRPQRDGLDAMLDKMSLTNLEAPWRDPAATNATPPPTVVERDYRSPDNHAVRLEVAGEGTLPKFNAVLDLIESAKLIPPFDTLQVSGGVSRELGAGDTPRKRIATWAARPRTSQLYLYRDGARLWCELQLSRGKRRLGPKTIDDELVPSQISTTTLIVPGSADDEAFANRYIDFVKAYLDSFEVAYGFVSASSANSAIIPRVPLHVLQATYSPRDLHWLLIFGPHHERILPRAELIKLPGIAAVHETKRNILLVTSPTSRTPIDAARASLIVNGLTALGFKTFARRHGYDPRAYAKELDAALTKYGFRRHDDEPLVSPWAQAWVRTSRPGRRDAIVVTIMSPMIKPALEVTLKCANAADNSDVGSWWPSQRFLSPSTFPFWLAESNAELGSALRAIESALPAEMEWFALQNPPLPDPPSEA